MSRPSRIAVEAALKDLPGWVKGEGARESIMRTFQFPDFNAAFGFMTRVALLADKFDHHPEWFNVYGRVDVVLTTHDADGVTEMDVRLARFMDEIAVTAGV